MNPTRAVFAVSWASADVAATTARRTLAAVLAGHRVLMSLPQRWASRVVPRTLARHISSVVSKPEVTVRGGELGLRGFVAELS